MGTVFDVEEAAESELRIVFTLADIDELWVGITLKLLHVLTEW